ncbi:MAG: hypothetical protein NVSMB27_04150 [Ktedonobacteraceae bacterium]
MLCSQCHTPLEDDAVFCGNCGAQVTSPQSGGMKTVVDRTTPDPLTNNGEQVTVLSNRFGSSPPTILPSSLQKHPVGAVTDSPGQRNVSPPLDTRPSSPGHTRRNVLIGLLLLVLIASGSAGLAFVLKNNTNTGSDAAASASGQVAFVDSQNGPAGHTNALKIAINGLIAPPNGSQYNAWLINDQSEQVTSLGTLVESGQKFSLNFVAATDRRQQSINLLGLGDKLEITLEQGQVSLPTGKVVLSSTFPPKAVIHIRHLLLSFPITPGKIGLLPGLLNQAQLLNEQALVLQNLSGSGNSFAVQCAAQSIIDISEGNNGSHYQPLANGCASQNITKAGDSFGLLGQGYIVTASSHASLAATQPDATNNIRIHAGHVEIAMTNIKGWVTTVDQDALKLLANPSDTSIVQEMVNLSDHAYHGVDINGDEQVDPVTGEAGAITAYIHGQLMAALSLVPSA